MLGFKVESNKEEFLREYIKNLVEEDVFVLLITQEGNSSFYLENFTDNRIITYEILVSDSLDDRKTQKKRN